MKTILTERRRHQMSDKGEQKKVLDMNDPKTRKQYREMRKKLDRKLKPTTDAIRRSQHITADDLNIRVGPCHDD
jgi:hypothetical protein